MFERRHLPLKIVDAKDLSEDYRQLLKPGQVLTDREGRGRHLPRFFYEIDTWKTALELKLTPHFNLWEFINIDVREAEQMRSFPRYVPCAVTVMAAYLEMFREKVGTYVHIAANGGYRSPAHALSTFASPHNWATGVNIYRIGNENLDDRERIERFGEMAKSLLPAVWVRPFGYTPGFTIDHLHLDLGYVTVVPHDFSDEDS